MKKQYDAGLDGELQAEHYLVGLGMTVIARRYRGQDGEIDLIMQQDETIVFVEVKFRPGSQQGRGIQAITPAKQKRMTHAAQIFLLEMQWMERPVRFDVVEISRSGILYIPNAFWATE